VGALRHDGRPADASTPAVLSLCAALFCDPARPSAALLDELDGLVSRLHDEADPARIVWIGRAAFFADRMDACREAHWRVVQDGPAGGAVASAIGAVINLCLPIGGARSIGRFLDLFGPRGLGVRLAGLCDAGEEGDFRRGLERAGLGRDLTRPDLESLGFHMCVADLEDELIRSLGAASVEQVLDSQGDLASFRILQRQPAQQGRRHEAQLRRFIGTRSGRKLRYARVLVEALDLTRVPRPLDRLLARV